LLVAAGQQRVVQAPLDGRGERGGQQHTGVESHHHALGEADRPLEARQHRPEALWQSGHDIHRRTPA